MKNVVCLLLLAAAACAAPARVEKMVPALSGPALAATDARTQSVGLALVDAGKKLNPEWWTSLTDKSFAVALRETLGDRGLLAEIEEEAKYQIEARVVAFSRPAAAASPTTEITIRYVARDFGTGRTIFEEAISTTGSSTFQESKFANVRAGIASEKAIRENLGQFADKLMAAIGEPPAKATKPKLKPQ
jgi:hypothetical protein